MKKKLYLVSVDTKWTDDFVIRAASASEAKRKAIDKFRRSRRNFKAEIDDTYEG